MTEDGCELILTVQEAKDLIGPSDADRMDTFVRIYLVPDENGALQSKVRLTTTGDIEMASN
jgi:uncharacterized protein YqgV (UPF0045/DUF77 family)